MWCVLTSLFCRRGDLNSGVEVRLSNDTALPRGRHGCDIRELKVAARKELQESLLKPFFLPSDNGSLCGNFWRTEALLPLVQRKACVKKLRSRKRWFTRILADDRFMASAVSNGLQASVALKEEFSGVGAVVSYLADKGDETF